MICSGRRDAYLRERSDMTPGLEAGFLLRSRVFWTVKVKAWRLERVV